MSLLKQLRYLNTRRTKEWTGNEPRIEDCDFYSNELIGEIGEAANIIKKISRHQREWRGGLDPKSFTTKQMLGEELADVVICCDLLALSLNIDLQSVAESFINNGGNSLVDYVRFQDACDHISQQMVLELTGTTVNPLHCDFYSNMMCTQALGASEMVKQISMKLHHWTPPAELMHDEDPLVVSQYALTSTIFCANHLATIFEIDLDNSIATKFNKTSSKMNLSIKFPQLS